MALVKVKPTSAGRRSLVKVVNPLLHKGPPVASLVESQKRGSGRNNNGHITMRHQGGGHKHHYRIVDFKRNKDGIPAKVDSIQYDPNRSARIALLNYVDGEKRYIVAPHGLKAGDTVMSGPDAPPNVGNCLPLTKIPLGMAIHNIELQAGRGGTLCRSAGTSATLMAREAGWAQISLPSGEIRRIPSACRATIGTTGNPDRMAIVWGKAGRRRWLGRKPHNRGTAMNPIDHPHGGGEGRTKGGRHPVSPTGKSAKGGMTRKPRKASNKAIVRRRRSRRYGVQKLHTK